MFCRYCFLLARSPFCVVFVLTVSCLGIHGDRPTSSRHGLLRTYVDAPAVRRKLFTGAP